MADEDYMDDNDLSSNRLSDETLDDDSNLLEDYNSENASADANDSDDDFFERTVARSSNRKRDIEDYFDRRQLANLDDWYSNL